MGIGLCLYGFMIDRAREKEDDGEIQDIQKVLKIIKTFL